MDFQGDRETPFGKLYWPKSFRVQIPVLVAAFAGGPVIGWILGMLLGGVSETGQIFLYVSPALIFFFGYALWAARLAAMAFNVFGKRLVWALFQLITKRQRPQSVQELMPTREKLEQFSVRSQRAAWSFLVVSLPVGAVCGALGGLLETQSRKWFQIIVLATGCVLWGFALSLLGRRGYLPLPETDE